ncbi:hypothetical protein, variant [Aphanomyces astaci]|uniref:MalT-like TPR region domain-containing protein n=1 Tax=Aphanomyces astaci TaxID=112090 RepID=W4GMM8_APHAT|nr:hypothetical protein, variant [Aphanomyces astaci]ETV80960.1 hypothetical protein, variant [Aphanomyces astaci]|eukprot:XP_009829907.1 hypothetical protein, variant [Aphanomyces astaci]
MFRAVFAAATRPVALHRPLSRYVHQKQSYEELKADFARWARKEVVLVGLFLATGLGAVAAYTYRSDAPLHQIVYCINQATIAAEKGNALEARQLTQRAYAIAQSVSPHERHLHELAFSIAAQYEAAEQFHLAKKYYIDSLEHIPYIRNAAEKAELTRMITLDRIAQCCHNLSDVKDAVRYYEKALELHVQYKISTCTPMDVEGCGIWFNYGRLCLDMDQPEKAKPLFDTAKRVAIKCNLPQDKIDLIDDQLAVASRHENGPVDITQQHPHEVM